jgi:hypothetical protein
MGQSTKRQKKKTRSAVIIRIGKVVSFYFRAHALMPAEHALRLALLYLTGGGKATDGIFVEMLLACLACDAC